jgi:hypothetical protein
VQGSSWISGWWLGDQSTNERGEELFAPFARIVNKLEEPEDISEAFPVKYLDADVTRSAGATRTLSWY